MRRLRWLNASLVLVSWLSVSPASGSEWKAAMASGDITPKEQVWMGGYAARKGPSEGVLQPIHLKMLVLKDAEGRKGVIVTADLIGIPKSLRLALESAARDTHGIEAHELLLNASHTHSGPMIRTYRPPGDGKEEPAYSAIPEEQHSLRIAQTERYLERVEEVFLHLLDSCLESLQPAILSFSRARCGFAMNRRTPTGSGGWRNFPNPEAPVDHEVPVLQVRGSGDGSLLGVLFGYSCHATVLSGMELHGDWPGFAQHFFEEDHPGTVAMFLNGCSGDQNPYPRRMLPYVHRHGRSMATAIEAALETEALPLPPRIRSAIEWEEILYQEPLPEEELKQKAESGDRYEARYARLLLAAMQSTEGLPESYPVPVQVFRLGDALTLATIGGEVVIDYSLRLKKELGELTGGPVWVAGYSNDMMTYIPSRRVLEEGGYEGGQSMRYVRSSIHPAPWEPAIEDKLVGRIRSLTIELMQRAEAPE